MRGKMSHRCSTSVILRRTYDLHPPPAPGGPKQSAIHVRILRFTNKICDSRSDSAIHVRILRFTFGLCDSLKNCAH